MNNLTQNTVTSLLDYKDGLLYWRSDMAYRAKKGDLAGTFNKTTGRRVIAINGKIHGCHRVIFLMFNGFMPEYVDHIDTDKTNDRKENLRECTSSQNNCNRKMQKNNKSGVKGVSWHKARSNWSVFIDVGGEKVYLGCYKTLKEAKEVIFKARKKYHQEFANHG